MALMEAEKAALEQARIQAEERTASLQALREELEANAREEKEKSGRGLPGCGGETTSTGSVEA